ncbi:hypothetical protein KY284_031183 [Solanum tuberosum]|nr:hypothetical protein KY284_031183 [Solanum tuberosum]
MTAEQVMEGDWHWLKTPIRLQWWNPLSGTIEKKNGPDTTWVKIVGLPLHLWTHKVFKSIGDHCRGWVETEEETSIRNHLKWARLRIRGDGSNIPREIKIENGGLVFTMQIWVETPVKVEAGEDKQNRSFIQQILGDNPMGKRSDEADEATDIVQRDRARVESNPRPCAIVGTSGVQQLLSLTNKAQIQSVEREILGPKESLGHNPTEVNLTPLILKGKSREAHEDSLSGLKNIKELASQFLEAFRAWEFSPNLNVRENMASQVTPEENSLMQVKERIESNINNDMSRRAENEYISMDQTPPETRETDLQIQQILDAEPVAMQNLAESETTETEAPSWVNSHILELSNTYGVAFEGFEKETLALLMRIDERKSMLDNKGKEITTTTPKSRGIGKNKLKNL